MREIWMNMVNTTYKSTEDMMNKLQEIKGKTNLKFYKNKSNHYKEMKRKKFQTQEDTFTKNAEGFSKYYHEAFVLMKFLQIKPQVKNLIINYFDLNFTVSKVEMIKMKIVKMILIIFTISSVLIITLELNHVKQH